jgi:hypothetical protein
MKKFYSTQIGETVVAIGIVTGFYALMAIASLLAW